MKWQTKARIMDLFARLPFGHLIYKKLQKSFGRLNSSPLEGIITQVEMASWILEQNLPIKGRTFFEVGTGHKPIVPIGFFLSGAERFITVDLYKRVDFSLTSNSLLWMLKNRKKLEDIYLKITDLSTFDERFRLIEKLWNSPLVFFREANIDYLAPADASATYFLSSSVDYHLSNAVLEHIPEEVIEKIFIEAYRLLKNDGTAIHFIDLGDHYYYEDRSITKINFLQFSDQEWMRIAGNQFAYCNRLRKPQYKKIFSDQGWRTVRIEFQIDEESINIVKSGKIKIDPIFEPYAIEDLTTHILKIMLKK